MTKFAKCDEDYGKPHKLPQSCGIKVKVESYLIFAQISKQPGKYIRTIGSVSLISPERFTQYHGTKSHGIVFRYHCLLCQNAYRINYFCEDLTRGRFNRIHNLFIEIQAKVFDLQFTSIDFNYSSIFLFAFFCCCFQGFLGSVLSDQMKDYDHLYKKQLQFLLNDIKPIEKSSLIKKE